MSEVLKGESSVVLVVSKEEAEQITTLIGSIGGHEDTLDVLFDQLTDAFPEYLSNWRWERAYRGAPALRRNDE